MKKILLLLLIIMSAESSAEERGPFKDCQAPSEPFFMEKIKESYMFAAGEGRLKDIVLDQKNYQYREEIKELNSKITSTGGQEREQVSKEIEQKFDQMVWNLEANETMSQFPTKKSTSIIKGSAESALIISMDNLSQGEVDFLPPEILKKLGTTATIHYQYPEKKFAYFLSYDGEELPLQKVAGKIQKDFEVSCKETMLLNAYRKEMRQYLFKGPSPDNLPGALDSYKSPGSSTQ